MQEATVDGSSLPLKGQHARNPLPPSSRASLLIAVLLPTLAYLSLLRLDVGPALPRIRQIVSTPLADHAPHWPAVRPPAKDVRDAIHARQARDPSPLRYPICRDKRKPWADRREADGEPTRRAGRERVHVRAVAVPRRERAESAVVADGGPVSCPRRRVLEGMHRPRRRQCRSDAIMGGVQCRVGLSPRV